MVHVKCHQFNYTKILFLSFYLATTIIGAIFSVKGPFSPLWWVTVRSTRVYQLLLYIFYSSRSRKSSSNTSSQFARLTFIWPFSQLMCNVHNIFLVILLHVIYIYELNTLCDIIVDIIITSTLIYIFLPEDKLINYLFSLVK